jgi:hypothetical protein
MRAREKRTVVVTRSEKPGFRWHHLADGAVTVALGFLTSATEHGATNRQNMEVSRHCSVDTLRRSERRTDLFREHTGAAFL